jgi:hypothetical protein
MAFNEIFSLGNPIAIAGLVVLGVILSANGKTLRAFAHVGQEINEFAPAPTDSDSLGSVVFKIVLCRTVASANHVPPNPVSATLSGLGRMPVNKLSGSSTNRHRASAASCSAFAQLLRQNDAFGSAIASAEPCTSGLCNATVTQHSPVAKSLPSKFDPFTHLRNIP